MHLNQWEEKEPELVAKIRKELYMYIDDIISGSTTVCKTQELKDKTTTIFQDACFNLLKWHSNVLELELVTLEKATLGKRGILAKLAKIYDPQGLVSSETLSGKLIYRTVCDTKGAWDTNLSHDLAKLWVKWESRLPESFTITRSLVVDR